MDICLNENDQQYFGELFTNLIDSESKVSLNKAMDLFNTCQLSSDNLEKIIDLCGAKRLGHFGRSQFYIALKLIACAQSGLNLSLETLSNASHVPLPYFAMTTTHEKSETSEKFSDNNMTNYKQFKPTSCHLPPPPSRTRNGSGTQKSLDLSSPVHIYSNLRDKSKFFDNDCDSRCFSAEISHSPQFCENRCKSWEEFTRDDNTEGFIDWDKFEEGRHLLGNEDDNENSDKGISSDEENKSDDLWKISQEQREHYIKQFKLLHSNLNGKISGSIARHFFERSNLPSHELSKIWRLSDVDKDGALNFEEFCTAMHLVLLRRSNIELPDFLPLSLDPRNRINEGTKSSPKNFLNLDPPKDTFNKLGHSKSIPDSSPLSPQSKQWTKFTDSPTSDFSQTKPFSPSSATGMQPVNFDFNAALIEKDPKILHPVALRLSPDGQASLYDSGDHSTFQNCLPVSSQTASDSACSSSSSVNHLPLQGYQSFGVIKKDLHLILPPPPPPLPPPRPVKRHGHARSSSLDLSCIEKNLPKFSTNYNRKMVANSSSLSPNNSFGSTSLNPGVDKKGAFTVYRKSDQMNKECYKSNNVWLEMLKAKYSLPKEVPIPRNIKDCTELGETVKALQERNYALEKIIREMMQELATVIEVKVSGDYQFTKFK